MAKGTSRLSRELHVGLMGFQKRFRSATMRFRTFQANPEWLIGLIEPR